MTNCNHILVQWMAQPYDWEKGGGYYRLYCCHCGEYLMAETYIPGTYTPFFRGDNGESLDISKSIC